MDCIDFETVLNDFVSILVVPQNIFHLLFKALWSRLIVVVFSNLKLKKKKKKKEHSIIISRVISSHMGSLYIETP